MAKAHIGENLLKSLCVAMVTAMIFSGCRAGSRRAEDKYLAQTVAEVTAAEVTTEEEMPGEDNLLATGDNETGDIEDWDLDYTNEEEGFEPERGGAEAEPVSSTLTSTVSSMGSEEFSLLVTTNPNFSEQVGRYDPFVTVDPFKLDPLLGVQLFPDEYRMSGYVRKGEIIAAVLSMGEKPYVVHVGCVIHEEMLMCDDKVLVAGRWRNEGEEYATGKKIDIAIMEQEGIWIKEITRDYTVLYREFEGEPREVKVSMKRRKKEPPKEEEIAEIKMPDMENINDLYMHYLIDRYEEKTTESDNFSDYLDQKEKESEKPESYIDRRRRELEDIGEQ